MNILITDHLLSITMNLPQKPVGSYIINNNKDEKIAIIEAINENWTIKPLTNYKVFNKGVTAEAFTINGNSIFTIENQITKDKVKVYAYNPNTTPHKTYDIKKNNITIGKGLNDIVFKGEDISGTTTLSYSNNKWIIETDQKNVYANNILIKRKNLLHGDIVFIDGLKIIPYSNRIIIQNLSGENNLTVSNSLQELNLNIENNTKEGVYDIETERSLFEGKDLFMKAPRFKTVYSPRNIEITPPPSKIRNNTRPGFLVLGPQMTMLLVSSISIITTLKQAMDGESQFSSILPGILTALITVICSMMWPAITRRWQAKTNKINELTRIKTYRAYLKRKEKEIQEEHSNEKQILLENNVSLEECQQIIYNRKRNLWEKDITQPDFLNVRLGIGTVTPTSNVDYKETDFEVDDDILIDELKEMIKRNNHLDQVPQCISLIENDTVAVLGEKILSQKFLNSLILQIMTFHSFIDLKIVVLTNNENKANWEYCNILPHCWNNSHTFRYIATNENEMNLISAELTKEINSRMNSETQKEEKTSEKAKDENKANFEYMDYKPYYLFIIDDLETARRTEIFNKIMESDKNLGFSMIIKHNKISNLPSKCSTFINIEEEVSGLFKNVINQENQKQFKADINNKIDMYGCAMMLSNVPYIAKKEKYELPKSVSFLDMYNAGTVEQLNILDRWKNNNPIASLAVPVGIDQNGSILNMDIHEKYYGPHGLVAGTTGSGKSEWIITYILSLAVNFSPYEVQFVLIDYKGGGLAGSFENKQVGIKLPHLIGTITNLDKSEVRRALASIESELKRRQRMFNEAREKLKVSSMDIYKYQDYFRKGLLDEPMSHLLIISDEFAELKSQQPEFLEQLVSTARIGRSLGVHLILATQKPSGVVNDQIWSNSKFKVCLKVSETSDSNEMLKKPDAAFLKSTGAFYLQVGNDDLYVLGQSAYAGFKYKPSQTVKKKIDQDIHLIDQVGNETFTITNMTKETINNSEDMGEELLNILKYIDATGKKENINTRKLWLDSIPKLILTEDIRKKYNYKRTPFVLEPILGEYDDPYTQSQNIFKLPISKSGNIMVYGAAGSGKELLLESLIYSLSSTYTLNECNIYVLDFGAETLKVCENNPMVGDVITAGERDKIDGLFIYIDQELKNRKNIFSEFGGSYEQFIKTSGKTLPNIIVMINNIQYIKNELNETFISLFELAATSSKYGIFFIMTSVTQLPTSQENTFGFRLCLNYNTNEEYKNVFPKNKDVFPAEAKSRGIFTQDNMFYEFQTSLPANEDKINDVLKNYNEALHNAYKTEVQHIPYLPEFVTADILRTYSTNMSSVPIGIRKANIRPYLYNFENKPVSIIMGNNIDYLDDFLRNLISLMKNFNDQIFFLDARKTQTLTEMGNIKYTNKDFDEIISNLDIYTKNLYEKINNGEQIDTTKQSYLIINGFDKLISSIDRSNEEVFGNLIERFEKIKNVHIITIDTSNSYKTYSRHPLFIENKNNGIYLGAGFKDQFILETRKMDIKIGREDIPDNYLIAIENAQAKMVKMIEDAKVEEGDEN